MVMVTPSTPAREQDLPALPLCSRADLLLAIYLAPSGAVACALPAPRLRPLRAPGGGWLLAAAAIDQLDSPLGPHRLLVAGPLVTHGALRDGLWAQRHSLGLWVSWAVASEARAAALLASAYGLEPEVQPILIDAEQSRCELPATAAGSGLCLAARPVVGLDLGGVRDLFFYTRRGHRLAGSRCRLQGELLVGTPLGRKLVGCPPQLPSGRLLLSARGRGLLLELHGPGREFDL